MAPPGNKAKSLSSVNHTTEIIHHHQNLLRLLTSAIYNSKSQTKNNINGLFKCTDKRSQICKIYVNKCSSFTCSDCIN